MDDFTKISKKTPKTLRPEEKIEYQLITSLKKTPIVLDKVKKFTFGSITKCDLRMQLGTISDLHASIKWEKNAFVLKDENSTNGTYLNDKRIKSPSSLKDGDKIKIGKFVIKYKEKKIRVKKVS